MASSDARFFRPLVRLVLYYLALAAVVVAIRELWPGVYGLLARGQGIAVSLFSDNPEPTGPLSEDHPGLTTALVIVGALAVMLPVAWVYMITKQREGYDRSVVQTIIVLPVAICGVVVIVQNSVALAFSLAGIVAAVRFRNTLKDTKDAVYIFVAIGVGLAAGVQNVDIAAVISVLFNLTILALWWSSFGNIYADPGGRTAGLTPSQVPTAGMGDREAGVVGGEGKDKKKRPNALLTVHTSDAAAAQPVVEQILDEDTKLWKLVEIARVGEDESTLEYSIRTRKSVPPAALIDRLEAEPHVVAAEFRAPKGLQT